jgi:hypothetical protein
MGISLANLKPALTYPGLFKVGDNTILTSTLKRMSDGLGNDSPIFISTNSFANFGGSPQGIDPATGTNTNLAYGRNALISQTTTAVQNLAIGNEALRLTTTGDQNIAIGQSSMENNTTGSGNIGIGYGALYFNIGGFNNLAIGSATLQFNTTGSNNIAIGQGSMANIGQTNTSLNIVVGNSSHNAVFSECLVLGNEADPTANNQVVIGSSTRNLGTITTETVVVDKTWTVRINGANYKIPLFAL